MKSEIGVVKQLYRYPVKSMAGESLKSAVLGWHGIEGDRRFAFLRVGQAGGFPWLTAGRLPALLCYQPDCAEGADGLPTHVRTPGNETLELRSEELRGELTALCGTEVQLMQLNQGMFDEAPLSLISTTVIRKIESAAGCDLDVRRFRPNILVDLPSDAPATEDEWVGRIIVFGQHANAPAMSVTMRDVRCSMINLDPETGESFHPILKAVAGGMKNCAGIYGTAFRNGLISVGDRIFLTEVQPG